MTTLNINNTASDWHAFLSSLSEEASRDAAATDPRFALHDVLKDLGLVAKAYATRLDVERGKEVKQSDRAAASPLVTAPQVAVDEQVAPPSPAGVPGWLLDTLAALGERVDVLEKRVAELEENQQKTWINAPTAPISEAVIEDRSTWGNIMVARSQLRAMVDREHASLTRARQTLFARVTELANTPDPDGKISAELRQQSARVDEFALIDAVRGRKLDEIAALDDLTEARSFDVEGGWLP